MWRTRKNMMCEATQPHFTIAPLESNDGLSVRMIPRMQGPWGEIPGGFALFSLWSVNYECL